MILVDSSIWIDHFRERSPELERVIEDGLLVCHEAVIGELALGSLRDRCQVIALLSRQRLAPTASHQEIMMMVEHFGLFSTGIGYVDAHLLASVLLDKRLSLWTGDRHLQVVAGKAGVALHRPVSKSN